MNIHEYQAKALLRDYGAPVAKGHVGDDAGRGRRGCAQAERRAVWVVKAQIHAGGRGKGGGIKL